MSIIEDDEGFRVSPEVPLVRRFRVLAGVMELKSGGNAGVIGVQVVGRTVAAPDIDTPRELVMDEDTALALAQALADTLSELGGLPTSGRFDS